MVPGAVGHVEDTGWPFPKIIRNIIGHEMELYNSSNTTAADSSDMDVLEIQRVVCLRHYLLGFVSRRDELFSKRDSKQR